MIVSANGIADKADFLIMARIFYFLVCVILVATIVSCTKHSTGNAAENEPRGKDNMAYHWGQISLECTAHDTEWFRPRPTVTSRILALTWLAVYDAWSRYDDQALPMYLNGVARQPEANRTLRNKEVAISYAAYRAMLTYYYSDSTLLRAEMVKLGLDPDDNSTDPNTPAGIGNLAAQTVIDSRMGDGSNQDGAMSGAQGTAYEDYTGYVPVNDAENLKDLSRWQPKYFSDGKGGQYAPGCLTPHWWKVEPLVLDSPSQFRPGPPPAIGSDQLAKEVKEVIDLQANLTDEQRALVEFMRDGPASVQQAGHWFIFAQDVSVRDNHTLDEDVKMYFLVEMAAMDAFIASWDSKMYYDYARPYALVHDYYQSEIIKAWGGPERGMIQVKGTEWRPYSPETFLCPPFPSYTSGHSTVSGACSEVLRLFTGDDNFDVSVKLVPGAMTEPNNLGDSVEIHFPTFTETADMAGFSRVLGGYHIQADNVEGLRLGRNVAGVVWERYRELVGGK
jgi:hypothetical protein